MALNEEFQTQGNWLFRWRSYLPLVLLVLLGVGTKQFQYPFGELWIHKVWEGVCLSISILGLLIRAVTVGFAPGRTSGRNTKCQIADALNTTGLYSIVRHPLYLGNYLIGFGISLVLWVWWIPLIYTLAFCLYYERIMYAEEAYLRSQFGTEFDEWAAATPAFWPRFSQWRRPELPFSFRNVLRREYTGVAVVILGHAGVEFGEHETVAAYPWHAYWTVLLIAGAVTYFLLRTLKRHTTLLDVPGR